MDEIDRIFRLLVETIRSKHPELLARPFEVADLYQSILPYRLHRRELALETNSDYEMALLRLLSGERGYIVGDEEMQEARRLNRRVAELLDIVEELLVPLTLRRMNVDPALAGGVVLTTFTVLADVARERGYAVGDTLAMTHGLIGTGIMDHEQHPFTVSGVLAPTLEKELQRGGSAGAVRSQGDVAGAAAPRSQCSAAGEGKVPGQPAGVTREVPGQLQHGAVQSEPLELVDRPAEEADGQVRVAAQLVLQLGIERGKDRLGHFQARYY